LGMGGRDAWNNQWSAGDAERYQYLRDLSATDRPTGRPIRRPGRAGLDKAGQVSRPGDETEWRIVGGGMERRSMQANDAES